ncbi:NAD(P)-binding domain-containing protein [Methanobrevibacter sp.]|uniref:NAD(P)-binding domain-containing protein n=1 Tax=Methanobrevibacter sp. TaxID=66852 RepID=UPI00388EE79E
MIIGLIGFGKVNQNLFKLIKANDIDFITSLEDRSDKTCENIKKSGIQVLDTFEEVAIKSDILFCATSPKTALDIAQKYGKHCRGTYLDLNNISPETTLKISEYVEDFVDGAIIGKIDSENPILYISGQSCHKLMFLNEFIDTRKISDSVGDAAILKMLRSTYTKTLSALLIESQKLAKKHDLEDEFFDVLSLTEGDEFKGKSLSRIENTLSNSKRKSEELEEIISYFKNEDLTMVKAALKKLSQ